MDDEGYGSTTYYGNDDTSFDTGVTNSTRPVATAPPDASGGAGSFLSGLLPTLTNGLNAVLAANLNDKFGEGIASGLATVDANGNLVYKATPAPIPTPGQVVASQALSSPVLLIGSVALAFVLVLALVKK
jgi:hypothetical protein